MSLSLLRHHATAHAKRWQWLWLLTLSASIILTHLFYFDVVQAQDEFPIPRVKISIYKYKGIHNGAHEAAFDQFTEIIHDKIINLAQTLAAQGDEYKYLLDLKPVPVTDIVGTHLEFSGALAELEKYHTTSKALEVFSGRLRGDNSSFSVRSRVYLGSLGEALEHNSISLDLQIDDSEYDRTTDSHSLITLYALAMDARRLGYPRELIYALLGEAVLRMPEVPDDLKGVPEVKAAINQAIEKLKLENAPSEGH